MIHRMLLIFCWDPQALPNTHITAVQIRNKSNLNLGLLESNHPVSCGSVRTHSPTFRGHSCSLHSLYLLPVCERPARSAGQHLPFPVTPIADMLRHVRLLSKLGFWHATYTRGNPRVLFALLPALLVFPRVSISPLPFIHALIILGCSCSPSSCSISWPTHLSLISCVLFHVIAVHTSIHLILLTGPAADFRAGPRTPTLFVLTLNSWDGWLDLENDWLTHVM